MGANLSSHASAGVLSLGHADLAPAAAAVPATDLAAARSTLESERRRLRELEAALAESMAANEAARVRSEEMLRRLEHYEREFRSLRATLAARDATVAQLQQSLGEHESQAREALHGSAAAAQEERLRAAEAQHGPVLLDVELGTLRAAHAALREEHAKVSSVLEDQAKEGAQLAADLATARGAPGSEQTKAREAGKLIAESSAIAERARARSGKTLLRLEHFQTELKTLRAAHDALQQEFANARTTGQENARTAADLHAVGDQLDGTRRDLQASQDLAVALQTQLRQSDELLSAARSELAATTAQGRNPTGRARRGGLGMGGPGRVLGLAVAIGGVVLVVWFLFHLASSPPKTPIDLAAAVPEQGTTIRDCATCPPVTVLPPGRFKQGSSTRGERAGAAAEKPLHWVLIAQPLGMTTNAVTVDEFGQFVAATGRVMQGCDVYDTEWHNGRDNSWMNPGFEQAGRHPVTCVSWRDAQSYAQWLSAFSGHRYRLPSASEWEYAARAGGEASQPWAGDGAEACANANVADESAGRRYPGWATFACDDGFVNTSPVGSFKANGFGLNDMLGNVSQWTQDCWNADYHGAPIDGSARKDGDCAERELRGGSWFSEPAYVRANYRSHFGVDYRTSSAGIRLVRELD